MSPSTLRPEYTQALRLVTIAALLTVLTACGQKGPLRLPDEAPTTSESAPPNPNQENREP